MLSCCIKHNNINTYPNRKKVKKKMLHISDSDFTRQELDSIYNIDINHPQEKDVDRKNSLYLEVDTETNCKVT